MGFIFDNALAIPLITWIKVTFGFEEIHTYITTIYIEVLTIAGGLFLGIWADKKKSNDELMKNLNKILPLAEFEIRVNYITLQKESLITLERKDFMMDYWEIYKNEIAKWSPINIIVITEIYSLLNKWKRNYDMKARIMQNCVKAIETWVDWYNGKLKSKPSKNTIDKRKEVIDELNKLQLEENKKIALKDMSELKKYSFDPMP